jgi:surface protein
MKRIFTSRAYLALVSLMPLSIWAQDDYAVVKDGTITFYYDNNKASHDGKVYNVTNELKIGIPSWNNDNFKTAVFDESFSNYTPSTAAWWFNGCSSLTEVKGLSNLNLSEATNMSYMFAACSGLEKLDLSGLSTSNVKDMQWMFYRCSGLKEIHLNGFNTESVENMNQMFSQCSGLEQLDLSSFNTINVENMGKMFFNCNSLQTVYVGDEWTTLFVGTSSDMFMGCMKLVGGNGTRCDGFGISNPIDATYARVDTSDKPGYFTYKAPAVAVPYAVVDGGTLTFYYDANKETQHGQVFDIADEYSGDGNIPAWRSATITKVVFDNSFSGFAPKSTARWFHSLSGLIEIENIQNLKTDEVTSMAGMFYGCKSLADIDVSGFNTSNVTNLFCMFYECSKLVLLDLSGFDTRNVTTLTAMFYGCSNLKTVDLSSFDTHNVSEMEYMFFSCNSLRTIYAGDGWSTEKVTMNTGDMMFWDCTSLVGGEGTKCNGITLVSYLYAKIDEFTSPGYFTKGTLVGIKNLISIKDKDNVYFYLDGTKNNKPRKGINVINGKKIFIK